MNEYENLFSNLAVLLTQFEGQKKLLYFHFEELVNRIISRRITEQTDIEKVMDGLLDFGDDDRFLALYKRLCRYAFNMYPQMVAEHIHLFRLQYEEIEPEQSEEGQAKKEI